MANIREGLRHKAENVGKLTFSRKLGLYGSSWNKVLKMAFCLTASFLQISATHRIFGILYYLTMASLAETCKQIACI
jgi:hypothetical protein